MNQHNAYRVACLFAAFGISGLCVAAGSNQEMDTIKKALAKSYPEVQVTDIRPSAVPGLYEVFSPDAVVYVDRSGEYLLGGPLIATSTKTDLSRQALDDRDSIKFTQLPLDKAIKTVRGNGERVVAVFADPDCPYCHALEKELAGLNDITIYTFLYPLTSVHPDSLNKARAIWCAPDPSQAWHAWMILDQGAPAPAADCKDPIADLQSLGMRMNIASTPIVYLEDGHRVSGARSAAQLDALISKAHPAKLHAASGANVAPKS